MKSPAIKTESAAARHLGEIKKPKLPKPAENIQPESEVQKPMPAFTRVETPHYEKPTKLYAPGDPLGRLYDTVDFKSR
jgi:hypothetical protein